MNEKYRYRTFFNPGKMYIGLTNDEKYNIIIDSDGSIEIMNTTLDESSKEFWRIVEETFVTENILLRQKLERIKNIVGDYSESDPEESVMSYVIQTKRGSI